MTEMAITEVPTTKARHDDPWCLERLGGELRTTSVGEVTSREILVAAVGATLVRAS